MAKIIDKLTTKSSCVRFVECFNPQWKGAETDMWMAVIAQAVADSELKKAIKSVCARRFLQSNVSDILDVIGIDRDYFNQIMAKTFEWFDKPTSKAQNRA